MLNTESLMENTGSSRMEFRPAAPRELPALSHFLSRRFQMADDAPFVAERHLAWKYWSERGDWPGPRSFTARHAGRIVAHAAVWPLRIRAGGELLRAVHLIDWAASPDYSGAGVWLVRRIHARVPLMIATGGKDITKQILPVLGFRTHGQLSIYARPVRPLGQAWPAPGRSWKLPARLVRNAMWRLSESGACPRGWSAAPMMPEAMPDHLWPCASDRTTVVARNAELYRYLVDSPSTRHRLFGLERGGETVGYFCLSFVGHLARIADLWLPSTRIDDWAAAFRTATATAALERGVYEVSAWASTALGGAALSRAGFHERDRTEITVSGDTRLLQGRELHVQMIDCDASFLTDGSTGYLT
jgi:hypothetical protein